MTNRFRNFDIEEEDGKPTPSSGAAPPVRPLDVDGALTPDDIRALRRAAGQQALADERAEVGVVTVDAQGTVPVAGVAGWYKGDKAFSTSAGQYGGIDDGQRGAYTPNDGIKATATESAIERACRLFEMDFVVERRPAFAGATESAQQGTIGTGHYQAIVRTDTNTVLGMVGPGYMPIQPVAGFKPLEHLLVKGAAIDRGGHFGEPHGRKIWLQSRVGEIETPTGKAEIRLGGLNSFNGETALVLFSCLEAIECRNVLATVLGTGKGSVASGGRRGSAKNKWSIRHTASANAKLKVLNAAINGTMAYAEEARRLMFSWDRVNLSLDKVRDLFCKAVFPHDEDGRASKKTEMNVDRFLEAYTHAPGAKPGTAYGLLQATTYYSSHMAAVKSGEDPTAGDWWAKGYGSRGMTDFERVMSGSASVWQEKAVQQIHVLVGAAS